MVQSDAKDADVESPTANQTAGSSRDNNTSPTGTSDLPRASSAPPTGAVTKSRMKRTLSMEKQALIECQRESGGEEDEYTDVNMLRTQSLPSMLQRPRNARPLPQHPQIFQAFPDSGAGAVEVVAEQSFLITKLTLQLLWALRMSKRWMMSALRLIIFAALLLPALLRIAWYWCRSSSIHRNLIYGPNGRNLLDVYSKYGRESKRPVVIFFSGGAWIIGYKAWGAYFGKLLSAFGIVVVTPDYRNFPQGLVSDMVEDAQTAIQWVVDYIHLFGGDPENITLLGQSAGAHIAACTLFERLEKIPIPDRLHSVGSGGSTSFVTDDNVSEASSSKPVMRPPTWQLHQIRTFIGVSGPYNMEAALATFHRHGFDKSLVERIMAHRLAHFSPTIRAMDSPHNLKESFPLTYLFHGTADVTIGWEATEQFAFALKQRGADVKTHYFPNKSHTDPIIEDPIEGNNELLERIVAIVKKQAPKDRAGNVICELAEKFAADTPYYPRPLINMARRVCPF